VHKFPMQIAHDLRRDRPRAKLSRLVAIFGLGLALAPLAAEGVSISHAQWCQVLGRNNQARTPILDSVTETAITTHRTAWESINPQFQRLPWNPTIVVAVGVVLMFLGMLMLRH
jgi:hypothetical protein